MKRFLFGALALVMLLPLLVSCNSGEAATATAETEGVTLSDEEAVAQYLEKLRGGAYSAEKLFDYDDLTQYFELGQYLGLTYPDDSYLSTEVSDQDVEDQLVVALMNSVITDEEYTRLTSGKVQRYDVAHIVYEGYVDGTLQANASTGEAGADLVIGSGTYIDGFESGLAGKDIGSKVTLDLTFSPYYKDEAVAGKPVRFVVTIEYVQRPAIPEITAELINQIYGTSFSDMDTVRATLKASLAQNNASRADSSLATYLQNKIIDGSTVKAYPEKEMEFYREHFRAYIQQYADSQEKGLEEYLTGQGFTMAEFEEQMESYARVSCEADMFVFSIARKEGIRATDDQIRSLIQGLMENNDSFTSVQEMIEYYISVYGPYYFENRIISLSVMEMVEKAAVKE